MMSKIFSTLPVRVYFEDTDAGGVVYHTNYLKFMERARTESLRLLGYNQCQLLNQTTPFAFVVANLNITFVSPAHLDDELDVLTSIDKLGMASIVFNQVIERKGTPIAHAKVRIAVINPNTMQPTPMPEALHSKLKLAIQ